MVNAWGVETDGFYLSLGHKPVGCRGVEAGEMQLRDRRGTSLVRSHVLNSVGPVCGKSRPQEHDCPLWYLSVRPFPRDEVADLHEIIPVLTAFSRDVHDDAVTDEPLERDLIYAIFSFRKVYWRIDVRAAIFGSPKPVGRIEPAPGVVPSGPFSRTNPFSVGQ